MGYLIKNTGLSIITAKVILTPTELLTPGFTYNVPEYAAVPGYFWQLMYMNGKIIGGTTPYAGTSAIHAQASTAPLFQSRFLASFMQLPIGTWNYADIAANTGIQFAENDNLQIHNPGTLTAGNTELHIYLGATLIQN